MMGGSSTPKNTTSQTTIRYAPYIEERHEDFLNTVYAKRAEVLDDDPFAAYEDIIVDDAFFGAGYVISSFPSLYDMYGKFLAGLDIEVLFTQIFENTVNAPEVNNLVAAESVMLDEDITINAVPRLQVGMRDINSVIASTFVIGKAIIDDAKTKALSKFSAELKYNLIPVAQSRWATHLEWNNKVIGMYAEIMKFYYSARTDIDEIKYANAAKSRLWPFTVLDFERAALGALQGATNAKESVAGASTASKVIGGALSGAAMGAMVCNAISPGVAATNSTPAVAGGAGWGALGGAVLGVAAALTY